MVGTKSLDLMLRVL